MPGLEEEAQSERRGSPDDSVLAYRVGHLEGVIRSMLDEIRDSVGRMASATEQLVRLEEQHNHTRETQERVRGDLDKLADRTSLIEAELPTLKLVRRWILGLAGLNFTAIAALALVGAKALGLA